MLDKIPSVEEMTAYICDVLLQNYHICEKELTPYRDTMRFDVIAINRNKKEIRIFEVKSSRRDFVRDKKWQSYLPYCTHFAFAAPKGIITKEELPERVGLVEFWLEENSFARESYYSLHYQYTRGCKKLRDKIDDKLYISLLEAIAMRYIVNNRERRLYINMFNKLNDIHNDVSSVLRKLKAQGN